MLHDFKFPYTYNMLHNLYVGIVLLPFFLRIAITMIRIPQTSNATTNSDPTVPLMTLTAVTVDSEFEPA